MESNSIIFAAGGHCAWRSMERICSLASNFLRANFLFTPAKIGDRPQTAEDDIGQGGRSTDLYTIFVLSSAAVTKAIIMLALRTEWLFTTLYESTILSNKFHPRVNDPPTQTDRWPIICNTPMLFGSCHNSFTYMLRNIYGENKSWYAWPWPDLNLKGNTGIDGYLWWIWC